MVMRIRPVVVCTRQVVHGNLDDDDVWQYHHVYAHITEVNGAELQNDLFGKQYGMTWVARFHGNWQVDAVAFPQKSVADEDLQKLTVVQLRKHATRTDAYFTDDREVNADELE